MFESNYSYYSRSYSSIPSVPKSQFVHVLKDTHFVWEYFWDMCARILVTRASNIFSWKMWGEGGRGGGGGGGYIRINIVFKFEDKLMCLNIWGNYRKCPLRTYATKYFPHWNIFNTLHTVCFMHGLSIYEIKRICHRAYFFRISYRR